MTPEQRIEQLEKQLAKTNAKLDSFLQNSSQVDSQVVRTVTQITQSDSGKTVASETRAVDEGGAATFDVAILMDGFIKIGDKHVPYYNI